MHKKLLLSCLLCIAAIQLRAQSGKIDSIAVSILDHMSATIGDLGSCSITVKSNYDVQSLHLGLVKHSNEEQVFMQGPNKMLIRSEGDKGSRSFVYNGSTLSYYSSDKNQFAEVQAAGTLMEMIDTVNKLYGVDFPIADFFYPSFVDDIISEARNLVYLGLTKIDGKECYHIAGTAKDKTFQFWISNDAFYLPVKMVIVYTTKEMNPQYEAVLTNWQINPSLPGSLFEFTPPPKAKKIRLAPFSKQDLSSNKK